MTADDVRRWARLLSDRFERDEAHLAALDAAVGDGDHGAAMARGFRAAARSAADHGGNDVGELLIAVGRAFMGAAAGASGPLVASLFLELGKAARGRETLDTASAADGLAGAVALVRRMGRSEPGDKTLLDALAPAAAAADEHRDAPLAEALAHVSRSAAKGRDRTGAMAARRGRAHWIEGGGVGHPDPGATSMAAILEVLCEVVDEGSAAA